VLRFVLAVTLVAIVASACGAGASPSFDATGPCTADGSAPGAYPDL
jgi:hypothetical protein